MPARHSSASAAAWRAAPQRAAAAARALGVLGFGEVVAEVGDDELEAELVGRRSGQGGAPPQPAHLTAERREIGLRPLARARQRRSGCAAGGRVRALLPMPRALRMQLLDGVFVEVDEPHETGGERLRHAPAAVRASLRCSSPAVAQRLRGGCRCRRETGTSRIST